MNTIGVEAREVLALAATLRLVRVSPAIVAGDASPPAIVTTVERAHSADRYWRDRHFAEWCRANARS